MPLWRVVAISLALVAYAVVSTAMMARWPHHPWAVAALFGPLVLALVIGGALRRHWPTLGAGVALGLLVVVLVARGGTPINHLYVFQHAAIHASLGWTFAITLRRGATPLITMMAERVHRVLTPGMRDYTRWLTGAWVVYFAGMIAVSLAIYAFTPWTWWSFVCGVITPAAALGFFVGEHVVRYRRHPEFERVTLAKAFQAYRATGP